MGLVNHLCISRLYKASYGRGNILRCFNIFNCAGLFRMSYVDTATMEMSPILSYDKRRSKNAFTWSLLVISDSAVQRFPMKDKVKLHSMLFVGTSLLRVLFHFRVGIYLQNVVWRYFGYIQSLRMMFLIFL